MNKRHQEDNEYCLWLAVEASPDYCESCGGWGDHGFEEDSGNPYVCHACGGTGKCHIVKR